jgi:alpha,alpha-trehalase
MQDAQGLTPGSARRHVVALSDGAILNRYWDDRDTPRDESYAQDIELASRSPRAASEIFRDIRAAAESGWYFSSRWFADPRDRTTIDTTEIVPSDLNSLLFGLENAIRTGCERRADAACVREFARRAAARRAAIDRYLWDPGQSAYLDYRWTRAERIVRVSAATLYPLFVSMASQSQADAVADTAMRQLLKPGGIVTTPIETGQQWDAPNGWAPLQWIAVSGLRRYGHDSLAEVVACRFMVNVNGVYQQSGKLVEKYDVIHTGRKGGGGEYPTQDGFGWTNGVVRKLERQYPADAAYLFAAQCPSVASTGASGTKLSDAQRGSGRPAKP